MAAAHPEPDPGPVTAGGPDGGSAGPVTGEVAPATGAVAPVAPATGEDTHRRPTRSSAAWVGVVVGLVCLIIVLVFILQNLKSIRVHFFWATWSVPLAVNLLLAAVLGGLIVAGVGAMRILELRRAARRAGRR